MQVYSDFDRENSWRGEGEEKFDRAIQRLIQRFPKDGVVLDIGSSKGNFLISMRNANVAKTLVHAFSEFLYYISLRRFVVGYSTVLIAQKDSLT